MEQSDLLQFVTEIIEDMNLRYFVTGSTATIFYGEPRFTNDIDVVVDLSEGRTTEFCRRFPPNAFYVSEDAARQAAVSKTQFNIIHPESGLKVDVIIPEPNPFNESRFDRSRRLHVAADFEVAFTSPEDAIIKKMDYYRQGGSEKHLRDIAGVLNTNRNQIDIAYIDNWAHQLDLDELWSDIKKRTDVRD